MLIATLRTDLIEKHERGVRPEGGVFEVRVVVKREAVAKSGDPWGFIKREIALHLAQATLDTGVPKEHWIAEFPPFMQREFNLPHTARMGI